MLKTSPSEVEPKANSVFLRCLEAQLNRNLLSSPALVARSSIADFEVFGQHSLEVVNAHSSNLRHCPFARYLPVRRAIRVFSADAALVLSLSFDLANISSVPIDWGAANLGENREIGAGLRSPLDANSGIASCCSANRSRRARNQVPDLTSAGLPAETCGA